MDDNAKAGKGKHRRLYEESLVRNIMLATSYCIKDLLEENPNLDDEDVYEFVEENYQGIIEDTLEEFQKQSEEDGEEGDDHDDDPGLEFGERGNRDPIP